MPTLISRYQKVAATPYAQENHQALMRRRHVPSSATASRARKVVVRSLGVVPVDQWTAWLCHLRMVSRRATSFPTAEEMRAFLGVHVAPAPAPEFRTDWSRPHASVLLSRVVYRSVDGDDIPALLMQPRRLDHPAPAVVAFHQHNSQWHLGKSEVAGLAGDPLQAFGPTLAAAGAVVLAPDSICFEDRRRNATGITPRADDRDQHDNELTYRLINGDTLARKVVQDAVTAVSMLAGIPDVDAARIGALGHSYGGNTVLFHAAIDDEVVPRSVEVR